MYAVQHIEERATETEAREALGFMLSQDDCLGGRLLQPRGMRHTYTVQTFHRANDVQLYGWLPDGCRVVLIPENSRRSLGIRD